MDVFYVRPELTPHLKALMQELGLVNATPYTLTDDFQFDRELNAFLRFLVTPAAPSPHTWKAYAEQLSLFLRFLEAQGKHWKDTTEADMKAYWRLRRMGSEGRTPIAASSWRTFVAVTVKFFEWAVDSGLVERLPFSYKAMQSTWGAKGTSQSSLSEPVRGKEVKYVDVREFRAKLYPALQGTQNGARDSVFAALLLATGLRLAEANQLTLKQLPDPDNPRFAGRKTCAMSVLGKGRKTRQIRVPKTILRDIDFYVRTERADAVHAWRKKHPGARKEPERLFLSQSGGALTNRRWEQVFEAAGTASGMSVHPHMLRHSFAIYQLSAMVRELLRHQRGDGLTAADRQSLLFKDPLRQLQQLMGHSHISTTYTYLDYVQDAEDMVDAALSDWTDTLFEAADE